MRAAPGEGAAVFGRERFRQNKKPVKPVRQRQAARDVEGQAQVVIAQPAAERRAGDEAEAESRADDPEIGGALFRRADVRDVGGGGGDVRAADAVENPAHEKPRQAGRKREQQVIARRAE